MACFRLNLESVINPGDEKLKFIDWFIRIVHALKKIEKKICLTSKNTEAPPLIFENPLRDFEDLLPREHIVDHVQPDTLLLPVVVDEPKKPGKIVSVKNIGADT